MRSLLAAVILGLIIYEGEGKGGGRDELELEVNAQRRAMMMVEGGGGGGGGVGAGGRGGGGSDIDGRAGEMSAEEEGRALCSASAGERASKIIAAMREISDRARSHGGKGGDLKLARVVRTTRVLHRCTEEMWKERGVSSIDTERLTGGRAGEDGSWWNALLSHALSVWQGDNPDELDVQGWSAMHLAVEYGMSWAFRGLAKLGADMDVRSSDSTCRVTPLHVCASQGGQGGCALALHELGADLALADCMGHMPEETAALAGFPYLAWSLRTWRTCSPGASEDCLSSPPPPEDENDTLLHPRQGEGSNREAPWPRCQGGSMLPGDGGDGCTATATDVDTAAALATDGVSGRTEL